MRRQNDVFIFVLKLEKSWKSVANLFFVGNCGYREAAAFELDLHNPTAFPWIHTARKFEKKVDKSNIYLGKIHLLWKKLFTVEVKNFTVKGKNFTVKGKLFTDEGKLFTVEGKIFTVEGKIFTVKKKIFTCEGKHLPLSENLLPLKFFIFDQIFWPKCRVFAQCAEYTMTTYLAIEG